MRGNQAVTRIHRRRLIHGAAASATALAALTLLVTLLVGSVRPALAQSGAAGTIPLTTTADFGGACAVLPGVVAQPGLADASVSSANGGEVRLRATVEDYFDGTAIDETQWISGFSNSSYPNQTPIIGSGVLTLYGSFLRSAQVFSETTPVRFFEASAQFAGVNPPSNADIGFYRAVTPTLQANDPDSSIRLFIGKPDHSGINRLMFVRARDGYVDPWVDMRVDNWGDNAEAERIGLAQYRNYRIEWDEAETWYLIDGSPIVVAPGDAPLPFTGVSTRTTYVFLYNQDPLDLDSSDWNDTTPLLIDWVRAGQYPAQGVYTSCVQDAGQLANWSQSVVTATLPANTGVVLATRTSVDGVVWSAWADAAGAVIDGVATLAPASPSGRYLQYRLTLASSDPLNSPEVGALALSYFGPTSLEVIPGAAALNPASAQTFAATVRDANNAPITGAPVAWAVTNGGGVIDSSGLFTAGLPAGVFTGTVQATTSNNLSNTATVTVRDLPPVADAGGPYSGEEGQPVALNASASRDPNGGALTFAWDLDNDGQFDDASGVAPSNTWPDEGSYTIGVLATDSAALTGMATATVTIANVAPQLISVTNNGPVRRPQPVTVSVIASDVPGDLLTYAFDWTSDGSFDLSGTDASATTTFVATGAYTTTVRVTDGDGGVVTGTTTITVTPQLLAIAAATNDSPARRNQPVTVVVTATQELADPLRYSFDWDNDGSYEIANQVASSTVISYPTTGVKVVGVRVTDPDGGAITGTTTILVTPQVLAITAATNNSPVRRNQPATVTIIATQELADPLRYSFDWNNDGSYEITDQVANSAVISYPTTGAKVVGVRVTDPDGGFATRTTTITVTPQLLAIAAATNDGPVRRGQPVAVTITATQELTDALIYGFDFDGNGGFEVVQPGNNRAATIYSSTGVKPVGLGVADGDGGVITGATSVTVTPQTLAITAITSSGPVLRNQPVVVTVTATQELTDTLLYAFDWENDGVYDTPAQPANSATTSYPTLGPKTVGVRVVDGDGGVVTGTTTLTVSAQLLQISTIQHDAPKRRGQPVTVTVAVVQQLGEPLYYSFDWTGDGVYDVVDQAANSATTLYLTTGAKTVRVRVRDDFSSVTSGETTLAIVPQTLAITAISNSGPVLRTQPVAVTVTATQELTDTLLYAFDWNNDGVYDTPDQPANSATTSYAAAGDKTVGVRVIDGDGGVATATTTLQILAQTLQIVAIQSDAPVRRGQPVTVAVDAVQQLNESLVHSFDWNHDGVYEVVDQASNSAATTYATTGVKVIGVRVAAADGSAATGTTTISVTPQRVTIGAVTNNGPVKVGAPVQVTIAASQELSDALLYSFDWENDGVYDVVDQPANSAATSFAAVGEKPITVRVRDADGGEAIATTSVQIDEVGGVVGDEMLYLPVVGK